MGRTKYKQIMVEMESSVLMEDNVDGDAPRVLNHAKYDALDTVLKRPMGRLQAPRAPSSTTDGELFGAHTVHAPHALRTYRDAPKLAPTNPCALLRPVIT